MSGSHPHFSKERYYQSILANRIGGLDELPYLKDDMKYHLYKCRKEQTKDGDAEALLPYLTGKKEVDGTYFLRY